MPKFTNKLLNLLQEENNKIFDVIDNIKNKLLKIYNSDIVRQKDKNLILKIYSSFDELGKSAYKYFNLKENKLFDEAQKEFDNASNVVLKGGISNTVFVWCSEFGEHTCEECASLDGTQYTLEDDIPNSPHPNCKCYIEIAESDGEEDGENDGNGEHTTKNSPKKNKNDEPCDVLEQIENMISEMEQTIEEVSYLSDDIDSDIQELENDLEKVENLISEYDSIIDYLEEEYGRHLPDCENYVDDDYNYIYTLKDNFRKILNDIIDYLKEAYAMINTTRIFISNYFELMYHAYVLKEFEMDKYYHSKANCEATQEMGILGEKSAKELSDFKEKFDQWNNVYAKSHKVSIEEAIADSEQDQIANRLGRERGRRYPNCDCSTLMYDLLPNYKK